MLKFDHVGYLVRSADGKKHLMEDLLGLQFRHRLIREQADNTNVLDFYEFEGGSIELVESSNPDSMYNRFIAEFYFPGSSKALSLDFTGTLLTIQ